MLSFKPLQAGKFSGSEDLFALLKRKWPNGIV
jgi:hypothetical protein